MGLLKREIILSRLYAQFGRPRDHIIGYPRVFAAE